MSDLGLDPKLKSFYELEIREISLLGFRSFRNMKRHWISISDNASLSVFLRSIMTNYMDWTRGCRCRLI